MSTLIVHFPGGKQVDAELGGFVIRTDQPTGAGGAGSAPTPFDLFLASIATCVGIYVKGYCDTRGLAAEGLRLEMQIERDAVQRRVTRLLLDLTLPEGFPEQHRAPILRAAEFCAVKKHLQHPPEIEVRLRQSEPALSAAP